MKLIFSLLLCMSCIMQAAGQNQIIPAFNQDNRAMNSERITGSVKELRSENWYALARQNIREQEYNIKWKTNLQEFVAVNRKNQIGFYFRAEGYSVTPFSGSSKDEGWEFDFSIKGIQRHTSRLVTTSAVKINHKGNKLIYEYPQYAIEYINDSIGMRQNFIVNERPVGDGRLEIEIGLKGDLQATVAENTKLILSSTTNGVLQTELSYDQLKVWDNNHQLLEARMKLNQDGTSLIISVDDANAVYPVTVDPLNHTPDWTDNGLGVIPSLDALYGGSVSDAGDINNDGYDDVIIGAPANIDVLSGSVIASAGQAFIYLGSASGLSTSPDITLQSASAINALFGFSVSSAGDINNDGYDDVIVGAPGDRVTLNFGIPFGNLSNNIGKVYIYYGNSSTASIPGSVVNINLTTTDFLSATFGLTLNPLFGYSVSGAGDVNNDGFDDVIVGSPSYTNLATLTLAGRATIYLGSAAGLNTASPIHRNGGLLTNSLFGFSVSSAGDMNNDGADEVLIGAPGALTLLPGLLGQVYVYPGISSPAPGAIASTPIAYADGGLLKTLFGYSVSNAGDVNNDGFDDIVVGQPATLNLSGLVTVGKASVFFGSAVLSNKLSPDVTLRSPRDPDILGLLGGNLLFGFSVSGGKDLNCDGIDDIIVGEPGGTALNGLAGINATGGKAYIYYGANSAGPASQPGWELREFNSIVAANLIGYSVGATGDVNGDGRNDIIVGAPNGTLNLTNIITGLVNFLFIQSVGSVYEYNGCIMPSLLTLPVKLSYFKGKLQNKIVVLDWQTSSEQNSSHFEIERAVNGNSFQKIGEVSAKGESNTVNNYSFIDPQPLPGSNVYRLKMIDKDGRAVYSQLVTIQVDATSFIRLRSNLVSTSFTLEFNKTSKGKYSIQVIGIDGRIVQTSSLTIAPGFTSERISLKQGSTAGMYIIKVVEAGSNAQFQERIVVQ